MTGLDAQTLLHRLLDLQAYIAPPGDPNLCKVKDLRDGQQCVIRGVVWEATSEYNAMEDRRLLRRVCDGYEQGFSFDSLVSLSVVREQLTTDNFDE